MGIYEFLCAKKMQFPAPLINQDFFMMPALCSKDRTDIIYMIINKLQQIPVLMILTIISCVRNTLAKA